MLETTTMFLSKLKPAANGCIEWTGRRRPDGYGYIIMGRRRMRVHRFALAAYGVFVPDDRHVLHRCDNPPCCSPFHLYVGDDIQNSADKIDRSRSCAGEKHYNRKLTWEDVAIIRAERGITSGLELSSRFGIGRPTVTMIQQGKTWNPSRQPKSK